MITGRTPNLWSAVAARSEAHPDRTAVVAAERSWTYAELRADVDHLADRLVAVGGHGSVVAVRAERGYGALVALLGCLATGRVYLPLDDQWPPHRVDLVLAEADAAAVVEVDADQRLRLSAGGGTARHPGLAYLIFTSGSTGRPKGVLVAEDVLARRLDALRAYCGAGDPDSQDSSQDRSQDRSHGNGAVRFLLNTSIAFDISLVELLVPLLVGGTIVAPPPPTTDLRVFEQLVTRQRVTHAQGTPSFYKLLASTGWLLPPEAEVWCGGEPLDRQLASRLVERFATVRNFYGPTEATIWCTVHTVTAAEPDSVGQPFGGTEVQVSGSADAPTELVLGGDGLAAGYLRADDDRGRFEPVPGGGRVYRTGDLGYRTADGRVHVVGRSDGQVKVNGHRLELTEIEAAFEAQPGVRQCAAVVTPAGESEPTRLVAYVVGGPDPRTLRAAVRTVLPGYAVPHRIRPLAEMPLTTAGKVDRQALAARAREGGDRGSRGPGNREPAHAAG